MKNPAELALLLERLDRVRERLAAGVHHELEQEALGLASGAAALETLREAARRGPAPAHALPALLEIRRRLAMIREMLAHGEQVRLGLASILAAFYSSQYSARGELELAHAPRLLAEA